jgi:hypothetical protein
MGESSNPRSVLYVLSCLETLLARQGIRAAGGMEAAQAVFNS